jgi:XRE family aerobic/anaerobic benzoate catabolism transcriptional regulator
VVETGGSLVSELSTFNLLRSAYFTVWVRARPEDHMNRVIRQGDTRPMEGNHEAMDDLRRILSEREPSYSSADYQLDTTGRSIEDCVAELREASSAHLRNPANLGS